MMDIEKLKKVNQLATTLRNQGLATGRDDAVKLAGNMNLGADDVGLNEIMSTIDPPAPEPSYQQEQYQPAQEKPFMDEEKITKILQSFADQFVNEINSMNDKIKEQQETIYKLYNAVAEIEKAEQSAVQADSNTEKRPEKQETIQVKEEKESPRSGGFNSDDVSIDKFFYYGNK